MQIRVTRQGRITIPAPLRLKFGIRQGTRIVLVDNGNSIVLKPITEHYLRALQGSLKGRGGLRALIRDRKAEGVR